LLPIQFSSELGWDKKIGYVLGFPDFTVFSDFSGFSYFFRALPLVSGVTLIALTPAATEIANAVRFALVNQVSLSVQIGAASAVQVALVQMPCLTVIALLFRYGGGFLERRG
jgi:hypothetical protein